MCHAGQIMCPSIITEEVVLTPTDREVNKLIMSVISFDFGTGFLGCAFDVIWTTLRFVIFACEDDILFLSLFQMLGVNKVHFFL